jgi:hypothetical protein
MIDYANRSSSKSRVDIIQGGLKHDLDEAKLIKEWTVLVFQSVQQITEVDSGMCCCCYQRFDMMVQAQLLPGRGS